MGAERINKGINLTTAHKLLETLEVYRADIEKLFKEEAFVKFNNIPIGKVKKNTFSKSEQITKEGVGSYTLSFINVYTGISNFAERLEIIITQQGNESVSSIVFGYRISQADNNVHINLYFIDPVTGEPIDPTYFIDVVVIYNKITGIEERDLFVFEG